jgi:hypothetical protein
MLVSETGVRRGVSKRVEDGRRPPTLRAGHPMPYAHNGLPDRGRTFDGRRGRAATDVVNGHDFEDVDGVGLQPLDCGKKGTKFYL